MIRHTRGDDWLLFTQHDHALLSGRLAEAIGGGVIAKPSSPAIQAIALHDCGWPLHDDQPTLNASGQPLHVFESPVWVAGQVWPASVRRAANKDAYAGLLVSIHVMHLASLASQTHRSPRDVFEINKLQHAQVELQESLRRSLGMRDDIPLNHGLAKSGTSNAEDQLRFEYHLLRALDQLSLALLCSEQLFAAIDNVEPRPSAHPLSIQLTRPQSFEVQLDPWPFDPGRLSLRVPCRRLPAAPFPDVEGFREAYATTRIEEIEVVIELGV